MNDCYIVSCVHIILSQIIVPMEYSIFAVGVLLKSGYCCVGILSFSVITCIIVLTMAPAMQIKFVQRITTIQIIIISSLQLLNSGKCKDCLQRS
jgi:hypothetical protein